MNWFSSLRPKPARPDMPEAPPRHVAIIMDGNGRWAKSRHLPRSAGHQRGAESLRRTLRACHAAGVQCLTVYAFSAENWQRPASEVKDLMGLLQAYLTREVEELHGNGVRLRFIGDRSALDAGIIRQLEAVEEKTRGNEDFHLTIALSYGARQELAHAAQSLAHEVASGTLKLEEVTEEALAARLYTADLPDLDLVIRTGGEHRLSNFLLWQAAYAELYFTNTLWPDFGEEDLHAALNDFSRRERRFGKTEAA